MPPRCEPAPPPPVPPANTMPLVWPSRDTWPSVLDADRLVPNTNAFWLSLNVSKIRMIESVSVNDASRRDWDRMTRVGSSKQITPM